MDRVCVEVGIAKTTHSTVIKRVKEFTDRGSSWKFKMSCPDARPNKEAREDENHAI